MTSEELASELRSEAYLGWWSDEHEGERRQLMANAADEIQRLQRIHESDERIAKQDEAEIERLKTALVSSDEVAIRANNEGVRLMAENRRLREGMQKAYDALWDKKPIESEMDVIRRVVAILYPFTENGSSPDQL